MEKVPGCWEYMSMVWDELKTSKIDKLNITALWLDIANAYGSVLHQLIFMALQRYGVNPVWITIIKSYYRGLWSRCFSTHSPSGWHQHFRGIFTGCTASIILFLSVINVFTEYICGGLDIFNKPPRVKAFIDDIGLKA